jgi:YidC/Oxa1 family membrane protein insertase
MEQGGLARWLLIGVAAFLLIVIVPRQCNKEQEVQPLLYEPGKVQDAEADERVCDLWTPEFRAQLSTRGAALKHFELLRAKYRKHDVGIDLATTPDIPFRQQLRTHWRNPAAARGEDRGRKSMLDAKYWQLDFDLLSWELVKANAKTCEFHYRDAEVELSKVVRVADRPYELEVETTIKNLAESKRLHALTVYSTAWRTNEEVQGKMFRVSPYITNVECIQKDGSATRLKPTDFAAKKFRKKTDFFVSNDVNLGDWWEVAGDADVAGVSNAYFTQAIVPVQSPVPPVCQMQIEKIGASGPLAGAMYRARLAYPPLELGSGESKKYVVASYIGPKQRELLAAAGGGNHRFPELINLGFFSVIAKVLVAFLLAVHGFIPSWGVAIIVLTITARTLLFPLTVPQIRSMIKMRELKPEIDALNEKFKDDPQQKGLAQMELWRKHKVNPLKGCLPQLATLPVWFALYTTLQSAVELYNIPFLWFPDLTEPDPYFILPFVIGGTSFLQQKLMPMQTGGDPAQQKMMMYMMPGMFTVFMLFLPAGLGIYMFTNSFLGITQQQIVEWRVRSANRKKSGGGGGGSQDDGQDDDEARRIRLRGKRKGKGDDGGETRRGADETEKGKPGTATT